MKYKIDKKNAILAVLYLILAIGCFIVATVFKGQLANLNVKLDSNYKQVQYIMDAAYVGTAIFAVLFVLAFRKAFPRKLKRAIVAKIGHLIDYYILRPIRWLIRKLRVIFGLPEYKDSKKKDEHSFIFDFQGSDIIKRIMSIGNKQRWRDLEDNAQKIRYIYIKYIVKLTKSGFKFNPTRTPEELIVDYKLKKDPKRLFELYVGARYSNGSVKIDDDDVVMATKLVNKSGKMS